MLYASFTERASDALFGITAEVLHRSFFEDLHYGFGEQSPPCRSFSLRFRAFTFTSLKTDRAKHFLLHSPTDAELLFQTPKVPFLFQSTPFHFIANRW